MSCTATTNPVKFQVQQNHTLRLSCLAHAAYTQKVTVSLDPSLSTPIAIFQGSGEGVPMKSDGQELIDIFTGGNEALYILFQFSNGGAFQNAIRVCEPQTIGSLTQIMSEDSTDRDDNDSYLSIIDRTAT